MKHRYFLNFFFLTTAAVFSWSAATIWLLNGGVRLWEFDDEPSFLDGASEFCFGILLPWQCTVDSGVELSVLGISEGVSIFSLSRDPAEQT